MTKKPHILFITTDEQHIDTVYREPKPYQLVGAPKLMAQGVTYENAYTPSPVCLPARCSLMTGLYPYHTGCQSNGFGGSLPQEIPNLFTCLAKEGYETSMHGKCHFIPVPYEATRKDVTLEYHHFKLYYQSLGIQHLDLQDGNNNSLWFYDDYSTELEQAGLLDAYRDAYHSQPKDMSLPDFPLPKEWHPDTWVGQKALARVQESDPETPQFIWVSFSGPHYPMDAPKEYFDAIDLAQDFPRCFQEGEWDDETKLHRNGYFGPASTEGSGYAPGGAQKEYDQDFWNRWRIKYYANVVQIDEQMDQIITAAQEKYGDDLMIIYTTDHGEMMGNHGLWGKNHSLYEDVVHIPMVVKYPHQTAPETKTETVSSIDLFATILAQAGCPAIETDSEVLQDVCQKGGRDYIISACAGRVTVRKDGLKICVNHHDRIKKLYYELYDLTTDPYEFTNLWHVDAEKRAKAIAILKEIDATEHFSATVFDHRESLQKPYWFKEHIERAKTAESCLDAVIGEHK